MDIGYASDMYSFRQLVRADEIIDAMPSIEHKRLFYNKALKLAGQDAYVYQQYGIMELRHKNLNESEVFFQTACKLDPNNNAYKHSYARLLFQKSMSSPNPVQKERLFTESQKTLKEIIAQWPLNPYAYDSYALNLIQKSTTEEAKVKQDYLLEAHEVILTAIRKCPDKAHLQTTEAKIFEYLGDINQAVLKLQSSHSTDPTSPRTTLMLSKLLMRKHDLKTAYSILLETLKYNPDHVNLNLIAADLTKTLFPNDHEKIISFLKKVFDPKYIDEYPNYLLAVEYYRTAKYPEGEAIFKEFRNNKFFRSMPETYEIRDFVLDENGNKKVFQGEVVSMWGNKGFIRPDIFPKDVFFPASRGLQLNQGKRVRFVIGFSYFGSVAQKIQI
jgi:cytochrome c-type biogenesis protein CcmH/NrfG